MRSKASVKYSIPCLTDPVSKLEGLGTKTRKNLLNIRAGVRKIDARVGVPEDCPNEVKSGVDIVADHGQGRLWTLPKSVSIADISYPACVVMLVQ